MTDIQDKRLDRDEEEVLEKVTRALISGPKTMGELYSVFDFQIGQHNLDEALDILDEVDALNWKQAPVHGSLIPVYEIRKNARTVTVISE